MAIPVPLILSPALPSELLSSILQHEAYPTTLIICYPRADFLSLLIRDVVQGPSVPNPQEQETVPPTPAPPAAVTNSLLPARLYQIAIARHIRMVFIPTVSHLRAYLSVFTKSTSTNTNTNESSKVVVPPPPAEAQQRQRNRPQQQPPLLLVYGFLALHRDTSEWSAQGLSGSAAALVEASRMSGLRAVVVEPPRVSGEEHGVGEDDAQGAIGVGFEDQGQLMLAEQMPVLSASVIRAGGDFDEAAAWTGRKVTIGRVLGRWFRYKARHWANDAEGSN